MTQQPGAGWANPAWGEPGSGGIGPGAGGGHAPYAPGGAAPPPYGQYGWAPAPPQPGVVPLRPLGVGEVLDGAITTIRRNPKLTIGLAALVVTVQQLISVLAQLSTGSVASGLNPLSGLNTSVTHTLAAPYANGTALALLAGNFVLGTVLGAVLTGVLMVIVGEAVLGRSAAARDVWARVKPRIWALLAGSLLAGLLPIAGLLFAGLVGVALGFAVSSATGALVGILLGLVMLVPGAYLWGVLALTTPAITLERLGPVAGLRRSWQLAAPDFWRVWGIRALATVIGQFLAGVIAVPFVGAGLIVIFTSGQSVDSGGGRRIGFLILSALGGVVAGAVVQPFLAGVIGLLYVDRRIRGEGLDIALAESARTTPGAR